MMEKEISRATLRRLPTYLSYLKSLPADASVNISATAIAAGLNMGEVQVRKDLALISDGGRPKIGYNREGNPGSRPPDCSNSCPKIQRNDFLWSDHALFLPLPANGAVRSGAVWPGGDSVLLDNAQAEKSIAGGRNAVNGMTFLKWRGGSALPRFFYYFNKLKSGVDI